MSVQSPKPRTMIDDYVISISQSRSFNFFYHSGSNSFYWLSYFPVQIYSAVKKLKFLVHYSGSKRPTDPLLGQHNYLIRSAQVGTVQIKQAKSSTHRSLNSGQQQKHHHSCCSHYRSNKL